LGCGYTILRDLDEEERDAEWAIIDSLTVAPDLTISNIEYEYIPEPPRRNPLDNGSDWPSVRFYLTLSNLGNAEFTKPYLLAIRRFGTRKSLGESFDGVLQNVRGASIPAGGYQEIELTFSYPYETTRYCFTIVTNPIIQHDVVVRLGRYRSRIPPLSRELWYDNNEASTTVRWLIPLYYREGRNR